MPVAGNIYLVGLMGAGKSSVARELGRRMGRPVADTDAEVARQAGRSVAQIFATDGEAAFRDRESAVLAQVAARGGLVVATGGGIVLREANRQELRASGRVVYLQADPAELLRRLSRGGIAARPLLAVADPLARLRELLAEREPLYRGVAHHVVTTVAEITAGGMAERILRILEEETDGGAGPG